MILTIDIGNTHIKFAVFAQRQIVLSQRLPTAQIAQFPDLNLQFPKAQNWQIIIACVAHIDQHHFSQFLQNIYQTEPQWLSHQSALPFQIAIKNPQTIGADRLAHMAAVCGHKGSSLVIDMGTFLTLDYHKENQGFVGGVIFPGLSSVQSLYSEKSSKLPAFMLESTNACFGDDTLTAMQVGLYQSYKYILQGFIRDISAANSETLYIVATGGGWPFLQQAFPALPHQPDLTLQGLYNVLQTANKVKNL